MRVLVGWDNKGEAEDMRPSLTAGDIEAVVTTDPTEFKHAVQSAAWDVVVMALDFPSAENAYALFEKVRALQPDTPILGGVYDEKDARLPKFMSQGLHGHVTRDGEGVFILLMGSLVESAHVSALARRSRHLAERMREAIAKCSELQQESDPKKREQIEQAFRHLEELCDDLRRLWNGRKG